MLFAALLKLWTQKRADKKKGEKYRRRFCILTEESVEPIHMGLKSNVLLLKNKYRNRKKERIEENKKFLDYEKKNHHGSEFQTLVCLKNCLFPSVYNTVHEDNNPGLVRKYLPWVETISEKLEADNLQWLRWLLVKVRRITTCYVDVFKDSALTFQLAWPSPNLPAKPSLI